MASQNISKHHTLTSPFLSLPREIRDRIHHYAWLNANTTILPLFQETSSTPSSRRQDRFTKIRSQVLVVAAYAQDTRAARRQINEWDPSLGRYRKGHSIWLQPTCHSRHVRPMFPLACRQVYQEATEQFYRGEMFAISADCRWYINYTGRIPLHPALRTSNLFPHLSKARNVILDLDLDDDAWRLGEKQQTVLHFLLGYGRENGRLVLDKDPCDRSSGAGQNTFKVPRDLEKKGWTVGLKYFRNRVHR